MPELLEIEYYRDAADQIIGRTILAVHAPDPWYIKGGEVDELGPALEGHRIERTRRIGKLLLLDTDGPVLGLRFGMTGRLIVDGAAPIDQLQYASGRDLPEWRRFGLELAPTGALSISDPRRLGGVELDPDEDRLGIDALDISLEALAAVLARSTAAVKSRLMDQAHIAGLGNLLVDEILWRAGIDPARRSNDLDQGQVAELHRQVHLVLAELAQRGGSHTGDLYPERSAEGRCPVDGSELRRRTIGGRTTWSCPRHQR